MIVSGSVLPIPRANIDTDQIIPAHYLTTIDESGMGEHLLEGMTDGRALIAQHPGLTEAGLQKAREHNFQRYHFQGIGRYAPEAAYARGLADLAVLADLVPPEGFVHGAAPTSVDAAIYGFIANIYFYDIDTPLKQFVIAHDNLVWHCRAIHAAVGK